MSIANDLRLESWPLDRLIPSARNARTHSPAQVAEIAGSIRAFGFSSPILVGADVARRRARWIAARLWRSTRLWLQYWRLFQRHRVFERSRLAVARLRFPRQHAWHIFASVVWLERRGQPYTRADRADGT